jgi:hypothetical protein
VGGKLDGAPVTSVDGGSLPHEVKMAKESQNPEFKICGMVWLERISSFITKD